jgi:succinate-acetate transporter protein
MQTRHRVPQDSDSIAATATIAEALRIVRAHHGDPISIREGNDVVGVVAREDASVPPPARVFLQPIAAPSILGLYGFAGATLIVAANMAGWYGSPTSALFLFPFAAFFGGLAQFMAGMWAFRARDGLATAMHGMWGAFWMGYGLLNLMFATGTLTEPTGAFPELGWWFIALAAITWVGAIAALAENWVLTGVLGFLAAGATVAAVASISNSGGLETIAGWLFVVAAAIAWYLASAMMLEGTYKRAVLPLGKYRSVKPHPVQYLHGHPGVKVGQ